MSQALEDRLSRRSVLGVAGGGVAAGLVLAGCAGKRHSLKAQVKKIVHVPARDVPWLNSLLGLEYRTIAAYEAGIPLLDPDTAKLAELFLHQELDHAGELRGLLKKAKALPIEPPADSGLGHPRSPEEVLRLAHRLELQQLDGYLAALPQLSDGAVRAALASMFANDAQHVAIIRVQLHRPPAPAAFVTGRDE